MFSVRLLWIFNLEITILITIMAVQNLEHALNNVAYGPNDTTPQYNILVDRFLPFVCTVAFHINVALSLSLSLCACDCDCVCVCLCDCICVFIYIYLRICAFTVNPSNKTGHITIRNVIETHQWPVSSSCNVITRSNTALATKPAGSHSAAVAASTSREADDVTQYPVYRKRKQTAEEVCRGLRGGVVRRAVQHEPTNSAYCITAKVGNGGMGTSTG